MPSRTRGNSTSGSSTAGSQPNPVAGIAGLGGASAGAGGNITLTPQMLQQLITQLAGNTNAPRTVQNNNPPDYIIPPELNAAGDPDPDGRRFKEGNNNKVTQAQWKDLMATVLELTNADVHALRDEGIKYPWDFAKLDEETMTALLSNLKKLGYPLKAHSQKMV